MKRVVREQHLGFVATVCPDGTPNLSPKGTTSVWDDGHLMFANIASPNTIRNLKKNPSVEINVVDPMKRKGYRFKGNASIFSKKSSEYGKMISFFADVKSARSRVKDIVLVKVTEASPIISPAYDAGLSEEDLVSRWVKYYDNLRKGIRPLSSPD
ncbi:MAG: pyridoxamine 5'-phosphate oxidase family protein [Nitrososphaerales archaeon]